MQATQVGPLQGGTARASEMIEARNEKKLLRFQKQIARHELLKVDDLGFLPLSKTGADLQFDLLSQRYERGSTMVTSNLPSRSATTYWRFVSCPGTLPSHTLPPHREPVIPLPSVMV